MFMQSSDIRTVARDFARPECKCGFLTSRSEDLGREPRQPCGGGTELQSQQDAVDRAAEEYVPALIADLNREFAVRL